MDFKDAARGFLFDASYALDYANESLDLFLTHIPRQGREKQLQHMRSRIYGLMQEAKELENAIKE